MIYASATQFAAILPDDLLRFDIGSSRSIFDNEQSLRKGITATYATASMDVMPDELTRFTARTNWGAYSDGNSRTWWQFETERRIWNHPRIALGFRYTGFEFADIEPASGYYNPKNYNSNEVTISDGEAALATGTDGPQALQLASLRQRDQSVRAVIRQGTRERTQIAHHRPLAQRFKPNTANLNAAPAQRRNDWHGVLSGADQHRD